MLPDWYYEYKDQIESSINRYLDSYFVTSSEPLQQFKEAIVYALQWGKKVRAILALEMYLLLTKQSFSELNLDEDIFKVCAALELVHAYSLVHDDLPCMDNDELRRGQPTVWKKFWEYTAVLAGDLLNSLCFEILSEVWDAKKSQQLTGLISKAVGFHGMLGGQVEDIYYENTPEDLDIKKLISLHDKKTGALIGASIQAGAIMSGNDGYTEKLEDFWKKLGLAFQIKDDILDVEGSVEETGKSVGWETKGFVHLIGLKASKEKLQELITDCSNIAEELQSEKLWFLVKYIGERGK